MCDLCFIPRCDCEAALADSQTTEPNAAGAGTVLNNPAPTVTDALALDSTQHWTTATVRYAFPDTAAGFTGGLSYYSPYNEPDARLTLSEFGKASLRDGFAQWDALTALTIVEAAPGTMAEINVGASSVPSTAWAYYPGGLAANGDIWFNTGKWFLDSLAGGPAPIIGSYAHATGMHEFGHALGLKHPHQVSGGGMAVLDPAYDAVEFSIMSYRSQPGGSVGGYTIESWGYPQSPMMLDIAMIQAIYGADYTTQGGDTTYTFSTTTGEMFVDGVSQGVPGANRVFRTIWDGDGTDHIDLSNYATSMYADLNPGRGIEFDTDGTFQAARLASGVHAGFNVYMSMLHDGDTRSLIENLTTGAGDDILIGNAADNVLDGGGGVNTVIYKGRSTDYVIDLAAGRVTSAATGSDRLINIQHIVFDDITLDLDGTLPIVDTPATQFTVNGLAYDLLDQDAARQGTATLTLSPDGTALTMTDNGWASVQGDFTITADTVLGFTFDSRVIGEIHGIGFANGNRLNEPTFFQVAGTQAYGRQDAVLAYTPGSGPVDVEIAVGEYFTGSFDRMIFAMDDDDWVGADSTYGDIVLGNGTLPIVDTPATQFTVNGLDYDLLDQDAARQGTATLTLSPDGTALTMTDNGWASVQGDFTITADTVLGFTFDSRVIGEIHGIGFANGNRLNEPTFFQVAGTQAYGRQDAVLAYTPGSGPVDVEIAVGEYFTGSFDRMIFAMDDDDWVGADSTYGDIVLGNGTLPIVDTPATQFTVNGLAYDLLDQDAARQGTATLTLSPDGTALTMTDNGWASVQGDFTITADTVLGFTFDSRVIGEIHGIGFANGNRLNEPTFFQVAGTQAYGRQDAVLAYTPGSGPVDVEIAVGEYFTGSFDRMIFAMDDDDWVGADSTYGDIVLGNGAGAANANANAVSPDDHGDRDTDFMMAARGVDMFEFYDIA